MHDNPDEMEVSLTRKMGDEEVVVLFEYEKDMMDDAFGENEDGEENEENEEGEQNEEQNEERVPHLPFLVQVTKTVRADVVVAMCSDDRRASRRTVSTPARSRSSAWPTTAR